VSVGLRTGRARARQLAVRLLPASAKRGILQARDVLVDGLVRLRVRRGHLGPLPHFIIVGGQKCGTTYLYDRLLEHPLMYPCLVKEPHFFHYNYSKGEDWYRAHFYSRLLEQTPGGITGEASGSIFYPHAPKRVAKIVPGAKLIALLRNPVDRAHSHYFHEVRLGFESLSFENALEQEQGRLEGETAKVLADENYYSFNRHHFSYVAKGIYHEQLERWLSQFAREQLLVIKSEDFYADTSRILREVTAFLGLPEWTLSPYRGHKAFAYPPMRASTRRSLAELFRPHNERLYELLGRDLGWDS
jgi:hypothetical protein